MSIAPESSARQSRWERLRAQTSPLQIGLGLLGVVSSLAAVPLVAQRTLLLAVASVSLLFVVFDGAMRGQSGSLRTAAVTAHTELAGDIEHELRLDADGWYTPTEAGAVRRWHASDGVSDSTPPAQLPEGTFHDGESAGVSLPTLGWAFIEQTGESLPRTDVATGVAVALGVCRRVGLVSEWEIDGRSGETGEEAVFDLTLLTASTTPSDEDIELIKSVLGTATAAVTESPVCVSPDDGSEPRELSVVLRVLTGWQPSGNTVADPAGRSP